MQLDRLLQWIKSSSDNGINHDTSGRRIRIAAVFLTLHTYPALVVLGLMASFNQILGVSDPTSTQTVWSAEYAGVRPETVMLRTIPFTWLISAAGVILTAVLYFH